ncbi:MAG: right-handed parallel beta-helix repeat-containing protein [Candidatus Latescibacteria bacterium]|jgi:hypothetical protein|nr:right-handed parallel beta-helix repeat-containing protein [Candidatus Latescibacterota bacterium]
MKRLLLFPLILSILLGCAGEPGNVKSEKAVNEVLEGKRTEANAAWWGFDEADATEDIQSALNSGAERVIVPNMGKDWIVRPIKLAGNQEVIFEEGIIVTAKKGEFKGKGDCLFSATGLDNITLRGYGATLRMQKKDYMTDAYDKAEWRMVLGIRSCSNVEILGLTLKDSGGDGIYLGVSGDRKWCSNIHIKDVVCDNNYRQGISVISAENLLIEDCILNNTGGTAPRAGIDLEPNNSSERLTNCVIKNCVMENNEGAGILLYLRNLSSESEDVSVTFENCRVTSEKGSGIVLGAVPDNGADGFVEFRDCVVDGTALYGARVYDKSADRMRVRFVRCTWKGTAGNETDDDNPAPLWIYLRRPEITRKYGGIDFIDCNIEDNRDRPFLAATERESSFGVNDITGTVSVKNPHGAYMNVGSNASGVTLEFKTQ